jgi:hypothetical protein
MIQKQELEDLIQKAVSNPMFSHKDAVEQLLQFEHEEVFKLICEVMRNPYLGRQEWIICMTTLCRIDKVRANKEFVEALKSHDAEKRYRLLKLLGGCATEEIIPSIIQILKEDTEPSVRYIAALTLGYIGDTSALAALEWSAENDEGENYEGSSIASAAKASIREIENYL